LAAADDLPVEPGDLVLRDRGYFKVNTIKDMKEKGADSLVLYKHKTKLFDPHSGDEINLLDHLKRHDNIDQIVILGSQKRLRARIVARRVKQEVANTRRMRAKKESSYKNPSKEALALMSWTIVITTIDDPEISFETLLTIYGFRWRIENIFKTWKSNFSFAKIHNVSENQFYILMYARFIMIIMINKTFAHVSEIIKSKVGRVPSMMKFMRYVQKNIETLQRFTKRDQITEKAIAAILRFCMYDARKRKNFEEKFGNFTSIWCGSSL
jgi:hypothetical protein